MTDKTKLTLSPKELELVSNTDWILTKHIIIEKVYALFGSLSLLMEEKVKQKGENLPPESYATNPKISRGENYRHLPYVILDYPRYFTRDNTLAIRTLFWWGNFFSVYLYVTGECKASIVKTLAAKLLYLQQRDYWICINLDPWQHHFEEDNFLPLKLFTPENFYALLNLEPFVKIGKKISLEQWDRASQFVEQTFSEMITLLEFNSPTDETDL